MLLCAGRIQCCHTGDWVTDPPLLSGVLAGETHTITGLNPLTSYEWRWVSIGYGDADATPGPSTVFTTTPIEVDALIRNLGDDDFLGEHIYNTDGTDQATWQYAAIDTAAKYEVQVRNTSPDGASETVTVRGPGSDNKWSIAYFDENARTARAKAPRLKPDEGPLHWHLATAPTPGARTSARC